MTDTAAALQARSDPPTHVLVLAAIAVWGVVFIAWARWPATVPWVVRLPAGAAGGLGVLVVATGVWLVWARRWLTLPLEAFRATYHSRTRAAVAREVVSLRFLLTVLTLAPTVAIAVGWLETAVLVTATAVTAAVGLAATRISPARWLAEAAVDAGVLPPGVAPASAGAWPLGVARRAAVPFGVLAVVLAVLGLVVDQLLG